MKIISKPVLPLLLLGLPLRTLIGADLPKSFDFARYQAMMDRSPFAVATAVVAPVAAPNFAKDLYIANAARSKEGDLVTIASSTDKNFKRYLSTSMPPVDGYSIVSIEWSEKVGATKVNISKDGQSATLGFNEALLRQAGPGQNPAAQPAAQPPQPAQETKAGAVPPSAALPPQNPNQTKAMPVPMAPPANAPRVRGVIPRNPGDKPPGSN
jgi:hypothetical protein